MDIKELKKYREIVSNLETLREDLGICAPSVDTTREAVSSSRISQSTEDKAIKLLYDETYQNLEKRKRAIERYILKIQDITVRDIAIRYFIKGETFEEIGFAKNYDRRTVSRKLAQYINKNAHNAPQGYDIM